MRTALLHKALVGLVATASAIGLLGLPASANHRSTWVTQGDLEMYTSANTLVDQFGVHLGTTCVIPWSYISMDGSSTTGTWNAEFETDEPITIGGAHFRVVLTASFMLGTYAGSTLSQPLGTVEMTFRRTTGAGSCTYLSTAGTCMVDSILVSVTGTHTVTTPPTIQTFDTFTFSGSNGPGGDLDFWTDVTGSGPDCGGSLFALQDGYIEFDGIVSLAL
jgi:hypothetical protein